MKGNILFMKNNELMYGSDCSGKACINCQHFDDRTHFCRLNPPTPMVFYVYEGKEKKQNVSSKFPTICRPDIDSCSHFSHKNLINE